MQFGSKLAGFAGALFVVSFAASAKPVVSPPVNIEDLAGGGTISINAASFSAGFEASQGYALGPIKPQLGWTSTDPNAAAFSVSNTNPFAGSNQLRIINNTASAQGVNQLVFSPNLGAQVPTAQQTSVQIDISNDQGADYDVVGQAPSQSLLTWRVKFHFDDGIVGGGPGRIFIEDDTGTGLTFVPTISWVPGAYKELKVITDPGANSIKYYYDGSLFYTSVAGIFAGTVTEQVVLLTDNFQLPGETGDFDNLSIADVPEPASFSLLVLGAAFVGGRRRR